MNIRDNLNELGDLSIVGLAIADYSESIADNGKFELNGKRWVIRPNNFVTLEPHWKRAKNIAISLRGNPSEFAEFKELPLKEGMSGYSECTITTPNQLAAAAFYIRRAQEIYSKGRNRIQKGLAVTET
ncbi:hypothetical protein [Thalassotalea sp. G2M2-11]|uniref:hypothetical protein n=1 Tax=Thalassotalea sp. G2M2-11 TaxID=2787627 RepID=UPI0019D06670|nr:hypothetical protein [Thalassotalea sp. G2M2-11]